jgi:Ser/Thr protein kinase RdoA (MazF antagonist)
VTRSRYRARVTKQVTGRALVPDAAGTRLLTVTGEPPSLPIWSLEGDETVASIGAARARYGIASPYLRVVRFDGDPLPDTPVSMLLEFEAPPIGWEPSPGSAWLSFDDAIAGHLDAGPYGDLVRAWIAELRSGNMPPRRPPWARPGWHEATAAWLRDALAAVGRELQGPVEQLDSWAISSLLAAETDRGRVVLKSMPPEFGHEPALTRALAAEHPGFVPVVVATDDTRRHLVMEAFGGAPLGNEAPSNWADGLVELAGIQQAWIGRRTDATRIGVGDRSLVALDAELDSIVTDVAASPDLPTDARDRLVANLPRYHDLVGRLLDAPVPETLVHGDFHPWNAQRVDGRIVIFDWSDACWSHPFFDVPTFTARTDDESAREAMRSSWLGAWSAFADPVVLREALAWSAPLTELHLAISWRRLKAIFEQDGAWTFVDNGTRRHLQLALDATDELDAAAAAV